jgi:hypothetical protein
MQQLLHLGGTVYLAHGYDLFIDDQGRAAVFSAPASASNVSTEPLQAQAGAFCTGFSGSQAPPQPQDGCSSFFSPNPNKDIFITSING